MRRALVYTEEAATYHNIFSNMPSLRLARGMYCPVPCFFKEDEELGMFARARRAE